MKTTLSEINKYEWNYTQQKDQISVTYDSEFHSVSITDSSQTSVLFDVSSIPILVDLLNTLTRGETGVKENNFRKE
jgi:hypothetical protein